MTAITIEHIKKITPPLLRELFQLEEKCFQGKFQYTFGDDFKDYYLHSFSDHAKERGDILLISRNTSSRITGALLLETYTREKFEEIFEKSNDTALQFEDPFWYIDTMFVDPESNGLPFLILLEKFFEILCTRARPRIDLVRFHARMQNAGGAGALADILTRHYSVRPLRIIDNYLQSGESFAYYEIPVQSLVVHALWREKRKFEHVLSRTKNWLEKYSCFLDWLQPDNAKNQRNTLLKLEAPSAKGSASNPYLKKIIQYAWTHMDIGSFILTDAMHDVFHQSEKLPKGFVWLLCELHHHRLETLPPDKSLAEAMEFSAMHQESPVQPVRVLSYQNMAIAWTLNKNLEKAGEWQQTANDEVSRTNDRVLEAHCKYYSGKLLFEKAEYPEAEKLAQSVITLIGDSTVEGKKRTKTPCDNYKMKERNALLGKAHLLLAQIHTETGNQNEAEQHLEKTISLLKNYYGIFWNGILSAVVCCYLKMNLFEKARSIIDENYHELLNIAANGNLSSTIVHQWVRKCRIQMVQMKAGYHFQTGENEKVCDVVRGLFKERYADDYKIEMIKYYYKIDKSVFMEIGSYYAQALHRLCQRSNRRWPLIDTAVNFMGLPKSGEMEEDHICKQMKVLLSEDRAIQPADFAFEPHSANTKSIDINQHETVMPH